MKRATLFGIDRYEAFDDLSGCANDARALTPLIKRNEDRSPNFEVRTLTSDEMSIDRACVLRELQALFSPGADLALLYFAGHGSTVQGDDVYLCTEDGVPDDAGIAFSRILGMVRNSPVREVIVILDCCFSGNAGGLPGLGSDLTLLRTGVSILAASRGDQLAAETEHGQGKFSSYLCGALEGGAADVVGKVTVASLYAYLTESFGAFDQRPTFKGNLDRLHEVRRCKPAVPLDEMRQMIDFFPMADHVFQLDSSFEPEALPHHAEHEAIFKILQKYRAAKLLEPVGEEHMYWAAMRSKHCRLTPLGMHYWHTVAEGRL